jgi:hypothetical protein
MEALAFPKVLATVTGKVDSSLTSLLCLYNLRFIFRVGFRERTMIAAEAALAVFLLWWLNSGSVKSFFRASVIPTNPSNS